MGLEKISGKLDKYYDRLESGKAAKIKPAHVEKAIAKLTAKQAELQVDLAETAKPDKQDRIRRKLSTVAEQIERAEWLLNEIST